MTRDWPMGTLLWWTFRMSAMPVSVCAVRRATEDSWIVHLDGLPGRTYHVAEGNLRPRYESELHQLVAEVLDDP